MSQDAHFPSAAAGSSATHYNALYGGAIQPHGCLLCCTRDLGEVLVVSANLDKLLGVDPQQALGQPAESLLGCHLSGEIRDFLADDNRGIRRFSGEYEVAVAGDMHPFHVNAWATGDHRAVVELEPLPPLAHSQVLALTNHWLSRLALTEDATRLYQALTQGVQALCGYDRVLVYDIHGDGAATVIAESVKPGFAPVLGCRIPPYEFPASIWEAYRLNPIRNIVDGEAPAVPLLASAHPLATEPLDLRRGHLRAVLPEHRESMARMGVRSSLYLAIGGTQHVGNLLICHSATLYRVSATLRHACWTLAQMAFQRLAFIELRQQTRFERRVLDSRKLIAERQTGIQNPEAVVASGGDQWLELLNSCGAALLVDGEVTRVGHTPDMETLLAMERRLTARHHREEVWSTDRLGESMLGTAGPLDDFGGLLATRLPTASPPGWLMFFRREARRHHHWASDPNTPSCRHTALALCPPGQRPPTLDETVTGRGDPWLPGELRAAEDLAEDLAVALNARRISDLVRQLEGQSEHLATLARTDGLTGVANRYSMEETIEREIAAAKRYNRPCTIILLDVDHFKSFNDDHGHDTGDQVLKAIARKVQDEVRESDQFGRWGGEEFLVVADNASLAQGAALAERIRSRIAALTLPGLPAVTVSLGVAQWHPGDSRKSLVTRADEALYRAKAGGRNQVNLEALLPHT